MVIEAWLRNRRLYIGLNEQSRIYMVRLDADVLGIFLNYFSTSSQQISLSCMNRFFSCAATYNFFYPGPAKIRHLEKN